MGFVMAYALFALTTAIAAMYELVFPVYKEVAKEQPDTPLVEYKTITLSTFFVLCFMIAPLVFIPSIVPSRGQRFRSALKNSMLSAKI